MNFGVYNPANFFRRTVTMIDNSSRAIGNSSRAIGNSSRAIGNSRKALPLCGGFILRRKSSGHTAIGHFCLYLALWLTGSACLDSAAAVPLENRLVHQKNAGGKRSLNVLVQDRAGFLWLDAEPRLTCYDPDGSAFYGGADFDQHSCRSNRFGSGWK